MLKGLNRPLSITLLQFIRTPVEKLEMKSYFSQVVNRVYTGN
jgi:hypothetical protein